METDHSLFDRLGDAKAFADLYSGLTYKFRIFECEYNESIHHAFWECVPPDGHIYGSGATPPWNSIRRFCEADQGGQMVKTLYIADDGKQFGSFEECSFYEKTKNLPPEELIVEVATTMIIQDEMDPDHLFVNPGMVDYLKQNFNITKKEK